MEKLKKGAEECFWLEKKFSVKKKDGKFNFIAKDFRKLIKELVVEAKKEKKHKNN